MPANEVNFMLERMILFSVNFRSQNDSSLVEVKTDPQVPCEATNKDGFYSRVESYSISFYSVVLNIKA